MEPDDDHGARDADAHTLEPGRADMDKPRTDHRSRRSLIVVSCAALVIAAAVGGTAWSGRSATPDAKRVDSGTHADVAGYLAAGVEKSLAANTFVYSIDYELTQGDPGLDRAMECVSIQSGGTTERAAVDLKREIKVTLDADSRPVFITSPTIDVVSSDAFPGVSIPKRWASYDRFFWRPLLSFRTNPIVEEMFARSASTVISPSDLLSVLRDSATSVVQVGAEDIDGVSSDHLLVHADDATLRSKLAELNDATRKRRREIAVSRGHESSPDQSTTTAPRLNGSTVSTIDVWVGGSDALVRQILWTSVSVSSGTGPRSAGTRTTTTKMTFRGYGDPLPEEPPPAAETVAFASVPAGVLVPPPRASGPDDCAILFSEQPVGSHLDPAALQRYAACDIAAQRAAVANKTVEDVFRSNGGDYVASKCVGS